MFYHARTYLAINMRLLDTRTRQPKEFVAGESVPRYAILSHTWGDDEVTCQDIIAVNVEQKLGYKKIKFGCEQSIKDGLDWIWVDT